ncbi:hypothetical protein Fmac_022804 [Flemingia macrophylla]|uniref:Protein EXORDIUM-like 3 n=1 Tax=Flemingia macrophylla TaxID=520843 RepID=A0ABD1M0R7_9FABA
MCQQLLSVALLLFLLLVAAAPASAWRPWPGKMNTTDYAFGDSKKYEGSSEFVKLRYHMGPVLTTNITVHTIWYGKWERRQKKIIREFINSISAAEARHPSVAGWWRTVELYTDQTGSNISKTVRLGEEKNDRFYSHGKSLSRLSIQSVIKSAITAKTRPLPINPRRFLHLRVWLPLLHLSIAGRLHLPYAWVGNSGRFCPGQCAYPFAVPPYIPNRKPFKSPNADVGVDGMISVIGHEMAELATNPLANAWYAGQDPSFPVEIADLCEGIYGTGGGGSYTGQLLDARDGATYNMNGIRRKFLVQWVWSHVLNYCTGPNALDH